MFNGLKSTVLAMRILIFYACRLRLLHSDTVRSHGTDAYRHFCERLRRLCWLESSTDLVSGVLHNAIAVCTTQPLSCALTHLCAETFGAAMRSGSFRGAAGVVATLAGRLAVRVVGAGR